MFLVDAMKEGSATSNSRALSDLILQPSIEGYGLLDFHKYEEMRQAGYDYALPQLRSWLQGDSSAAAWVKDVISAQQKTADVKLGPKSNNIHKTEYGGRENYGSVRHAATQLWARTRQKPRSRTAEIGGAYKRSSSQS